ncbi:MAG: hypothetical protein AAGC55_08280, partial [Myxococcota bacterium]
NRVRWWPGHPCRLRGSQLFTPSAQCDVLSPSDPLLLSSGMHVFDTDTLSFREGGMDDLATTVLDSDDSSEIALWSVSELDLRSDGVLRLVGSRPLVIVIFGSATIDGDVDISSPLDRESGAGANPAECTGAEPGAGDPGGGGGGGGATGYIILHSPSISAQGAIISPPRRQPRPRTRSHRSPGQFR